MQDDDEGQSYSEDLGINRRLFSGPKTTDIGGSATKPNCEFNSRINELYEL